MRGKEQEKMGVKDRELLKGLSSSRAGRLILARGHADAAAETALPRRNAEWQAKVLD